MEFTKKITIEEQKLLPASDQKDYLKWLFIKEGLPTEESEALEDDSFIVPTGGGVDPSAGHGALPVPEARPLAATQTETEDHSDLPPSIRGELGSLDDPEPVAPPVKETEVDIQETVVETKETKEDPTEPEAPAKEGNVVEEPPVVETAEEEYLRVNEQTVYKNKEDAIKGIDEKDKTINLRDEELRVARQDVELSKREAESLRIRMEADLRASERPTDPVVEEPVVPVEPEPTSQELYDIYDDSDQGPLEAMKKMMPHMLKDLQPLIDMAKKLEHLKADEFIERMQSIGAAEVIEGFHEDHIYGEIDSKFPEFEGKWRDSKDPVGQEYSRIWHEIDRGFEPVHGASLSEISKRSPQAVQWCIEQVLGRMDSPSKNGNDPLGPATTEPQTVPTDPPPTEEVGKEGEHERRFTQEEAKAMAQESADFAVKAVYERNRIHGNVATEPAGVRTSKPLSTKKVWTKEMIRNDPMGWKADKRNDPDYRNATLDMLPQVRE